MSSETDFVWKLLIEEAQTVSDDGVEELASDSNWLLEEEKKFGNSDDESITFNSNYYSSLRNFLNDRKKILLSSVFRTAPL